MDKKRVLQVVTTMDYGGVETLLMSIYRNINREKLQFDFLCHNTTECKFKDEILKLGGRIFAIPGPNHGGPIKYQNNLYAFFRAHPEYSIIHSNINIRNGVVNYQAKRAGYPHRISHCHVAGNRHSLFTRIYASYSKYLDRHSSTCRFACSVDAGRYLFGESADFTVISNAIETINFSFSASQREYFRKRFAISNDSFLLGHVGRFSEEKNHLFILEVFSEILKTRSDAVLLLVGDGPLMGIVQDKANMLQISDHVIFAGQHKNLGSYYSAMDAMIFPSKFEGLGIVAVEAQCSGLPVIASDMVPAEAKVTDRMQFVSLKESPVEWAKKCVYAAEACRDEREACYDIVAKSHYNISTVADFLQNYYLSLEK